MHISYIISCRNILAFSVLQIIARVTYVYAIKKCVLKGRFYKIHGLICKMFLILYTTFINFVELMYIRTYA